MILFALAFHCGSATQSATTAADSTLATNQESHESVGSSARSESTEHTDPAPGPPESNPHQPARLRAVEEFLAEEGFEGAFVVSRPGDQAPEMLVANLELASSSHHPCSTFKIPNTLIGLETGVIHDETFTLSWDGQERSITAWNRDHALPTALEHSVVWYYQEVARRVGHERMRDWVVRLEFGNGDIGGPDLVDTFWLDGPLQISPLEQVRFLRRLTAGELPISERSLGILIEVMPQREHGEARVLAKTGTCVDESTSHAWLVGWVDSPGGARAHFALLLLGGGHSVRELWQARWDVALESLELAGAVASVGDFDAS